MMETVFTVQMETGDIFANIHVVLDVVINVTGLENVAVNLHGRDRDVMSVDKDTGVVTVRGVAVDVLIYVTRMDDVLVNMGGQERDVKTVCTK